MHYCIALQAVPSVFGDKLDFHSVVCAVACLTATCDDVIKWKYFPRYWSFVREIHRSPVNSPHKGQRRGDLMFSLICARINSCVNNGEAGDLRRHPAHYDVTVMNTGVYMSIDYMTIEISVKSYKWNLVYLYRPPSVSVTIFCDFFYLCYVMNLLMTAILHCFL